MKKHKNSPGIVVDYIFKDAISAGAIDVPWDPDYCDEAIEGCYCKYEKPKEPKMKWAFREEPGMCFGNIDGEVRPLNKEAIETLRGKNFEQLLFGCKKLYLTQRDYEEVEDYFSTIGNDLE